MATDRPRRSTRSQDLAKNAAPSASVPSSSRRAKATKNDGIDLDHLLTNPKSRLTTMDMTVIDFAVDIFLLDTNCRGTGDTSNRYMDVVIARVTEQANSAAAPNCFHDFQTQNKSFTPFGLLPRKKGCG
jgi:hypothetical protein